ncbi:mobile mystery protein A [Brumimicrobium mesophilum]|uniref:mobile mystery protein A n=1 Tax=Brumimicrobium mesophilum TaxID=392717 RepID=UPI000D142E95|nr:mobile mystery protein A [Brumimicrobium mesophilum]
MRNNKKLLVEQIDRKIAPFQEVNNVIIPNVGWISAIRNAINMTMAQLGDKLNMTRQGVKYHEESEIKGSITLNTLREFGEAMDLKLVYGFVPKDGTIENLIDRKAKELATKIVMRTNQNMVLEDQGIYGDKIDNNIEELTEVLKREMRKSLWD